MPQLCRLEAQHNSSDGRSDDHLNLVYRVTHFTVGSWLLRWNPCSVGRRRNISVATGEQMKLAASANKLRSPAAAGCLRAELTPYPSR
jgi:hypothetical protein